MEGSDIILGHVYRVIGRCYEGMAIAVKRSLNQPDMVQLEWMSSYYHVQTGWHPIGSIERRDDDEHQ